MIKTKARFALMMIATLLGAGPWTLSAAGPAEETGARARDAVARIVQASKGTYGVAARHLESGEGFAVNGEDTFPMASVFKLPILTEVMAEIRGGRFGLADEWSLGPEDQFYEGSLLSDLKAPGVRLSVENIINLMMWLSDNTATDLLLRKVGVDAVNARMKASGIEGIRVDRSVREILLDYFLGEAAEYKTAPKEKIARVMARRSAENPGAQARIRADFAKIPKDLATPLAINALLEKLFRKEILDAASCDRILEVMAGCQTGSRRIRGLLPEGTVVAHKTGTIGGTINDCGIIELPGGSGYVALSVLSKDADPEAAEDTIALIAKTVYDYFLFTARAD